MKSQVFRIGFMSPTHDDERWCHCHGHRQWAEAERETLCGDGIPLDPTHTIFECVIIRWMHFDDRAVDAVFEQTLSLVLPSSFGCLSPHSEGAILFYEKHLFLEMNKLKEPAAQYTNDDTLYFCSHSDSDSDSDSVSDSPILRFLISNFRSELI